MPAKWLECDGRVLRGFPEGHGEARRPGVASRPPYGVEPPKAPSPSSEGRAERPTLPPSRRVGTWHPPPPGALAKSGAVAPQRLPHDGYAAGTTLHSRTA